MGGWAGTTVLGEPDTSGAQWNIRGQSQEQVGSLGPRLGVRSPKGSLLTDTQESLWLWKYVRMQQQQEGPPFLQRVFS